jgi:outer membrane immunogenic protein
MKFIAVAALASVISAPAFAADMAVKARPAPLAPVYNWTGCYLDAGGGYGMWNQSHYSEILPGGAPLTGEFTAGGRGYYGTVGGGCDYQFPVGGLGNFVVGVLGGYDFMSLKGAFSSLLGPSAYEKENGSWDAGGRIGYLVTPTFLTYMSGGYTQAHFSSINFANTNALPSHTYHGYFLGGGAETSLSPWLPVGFSTYSAADLAYTTAGVPNGAGEHMNKYVQQIGTELVYRFNYH